MEYNDGVVTNLLDTAIDLTAGGMSISISTDAVMKAALNYVVKESGLQGVVPGDILTTEAPKSIIVKETPEARADRKKKEREERRRLKDKYKAKRKEYKERYKTTKEKLKKTCSVKTLNNRAKTLIKEHYEKVLKQLKGMINTLNQQLKLLKDQVVTIIPEITATGAVSGDAKNKPGFIATAAVAVKNAISACKQALQSAVVTATMIIEICGNCYIPVPQALTTVVTTLTVVAALINRL